MQPTYATTATVHAVFPANPRRAAAQPPPAPTDGPSGTEPTSVSAPPAVPPPAPAESTRLVLTVAEAAELLGISRAFAYELVARGEVPSLRLGRRVVVPRVQLLALVDAAVGVPAPPVV
jgi:excisionase family DNA binding protein